MRDAGANPLEWQVGSGRLKALSKPDLDDGLPCNTQFAGFTIQGINHRCGKVDIHSFLLLQRALGFGEIQRTRKVSALVKLSTVAPP